MLKVAKIEEKRVDESKSTAILLDYKVPIYLLSDFKGIGQLGYVEECRLSDQLAEENLMRSHGEYGMELARDFNQLATADIHDDFNRDSNRKVVRNIHTVHGPQLSLECDRSKNESFSDYEKYWKIAEHIQDDESQNKQPLDSSSRIAERDGFYLSVCTKSGTDLSVEKKLISKLPA